MTIKQYFIPNALFGDVIEVEAAEGVGVAPSVPGTYRAVAGVLAAGTLTVEEAANAAPAAPTGLTASPGDTVVNLSWTPSATTGQNAPTGHRVYRALEDDFLEATQVGSDLGAAANSLSDTGRTNGVEYFYWVTAFNAFAESDESDGDSATPTESTLRTFFDDFNRTGRLQDSPGGTWVETGAGTYTLSTGVTGEGEEADEGYCYADASNGAACRVTGEWGADQASEVIKHTVDQTSAGQGARAIVRCNSAGNTFYRYHTRHTGDWVLDKNLSGTVTTLASGTVTAPGLGATYADRLEVVGNTLRFYHKGVFVDEYTDTDTPITTGAPGMNNVSSATNRQWARLLKFFAGEL